jgi:hypothetical protein
MFPNLKMLKFTRKSSDRRTHDHIDRTFIDRRWHSSILDTESVRGANSDTDHYLVDAKFRERLGVSKKVEQKGDMYEYK